MTVVESAALLDSETPATGLLPEREPPPNLSTTEFVTIDIGGNGCRRSRVVY